MKSQNKNNYPISKAAKFRRLCMCLHRDLGFFFVGVILIYAISGIAMNHRDTFNVYYAADNVEITLPSNFPKDYKQVKRADVERLLDIANANGGYSKHFNSQGQLKILIKGGSSITADLGSGKAVYEKVEERILLGNMAKLHYNPGGWWTVFSDIFAGALILITLSGMVVLKGKYGFFGRGGILILIGAAIPIIFILCR